MIANRDDYLGGGIKYFPLTWEIKDVVKVLLGLSCLLYATSIVLYFTADFSSLYLTIAGILGTIMVATTTRLVVSPSSANAFRVYKLTAFPYLGIIFLAMCVDTMIS
jgi:heme O synthase-like polyprenyltransferase